MTEEGSTGGRGPVERIKKGSVTASIFKNLSSRGDFHTVTFDRSYKDREGNFKNGHSYTTNSLDNLMEAATDAKARILELDGPSKQQGQGRG